MAKARRKRKTKAVDYPVPQNRIEAAKQVARIGELRRELDRRRADMNDALTRIKEQVEETISPAVSELAGLEQGVQNWAEANRRALTDGCKRQSADLGTGIVQWRRTPPAVRLRNVLGVLTDLKNRKLHRFIRTKEEVNKEAMLAEAELAQSITGVTISGGEEFAIEPFEADLSS